MLVTMDPIMQIPIIESHARYYDALVHAHMTGDDTSFIQRISDSVDESLDLWLSVI